MRWSALSVVDEDMLPLLTSKETLSHKLLCVAVPQWERRRTRLRERQHLGPRKEHADEMAAFT